MIKIENVCKYYGTGEKQVKALDDVSLEIGAGEFVVIQGPSGSGKTTLLMALGSMLRPTSGKIHVSENDIYALTIGERAKFRSQKIGFVFQMFHLLPYLSILDNVLLASGSSNDKKVATDLLTKLDLAERISHKPAALSAGEKQRAALARAKINNPSIILADEPTGNLDPENAEMVMGFLEEFKKSGGTVVVVTHGDHANKYATKMVRLEKGCMVA
jgi:putative ABC transport system ATP-binding protein